MTNQADGGQAPPLTLLFGILRNIIVIKNLTEERRGNLAAKRQAQWPPPLETQSLIGQQF